MRDIYINSNLNPLTKFTSCSRSTEFKYILPWNIFNDHKDHPNQHKNSHKLCNETGHPVVNTMESQWKLRHNMIRISQWRESHYRTNTTIIRKKEIQNSRTVRITVWDPSRKVNHLNKVVWNYNRVHLIYQFHHNR